MFADIFALHCHAYAVYEITAAHFVTLNERTILLTRTSLRCISRHDSHVLVTDRTRYAARYFIGTSHVAVPRTHAA